MSGELEFDGLVAIVTGGASGIGAAVSRRLSASGAVVAVLDLQESTEHFSVVADVSDDVSAVLALTRAMAADHLREGIRVNCVSPGTTDTPWVSRLLDAAADPDAERAALVARQPHGRLVSAEEVADAVAYLASPRSGATTGIALAVDGGLQGLRLPPG